MGANWVTVASSGPGATARPSSSTTTAVSRIERPMPPNSSGMARAGQSRVTMAAPELLRCRACLDDGAHQFDRALLFEERADRGAQLFLLSRELELHRTPFPALPVALSASPAAARGAGRSERVYLTLMSASGASPGACATFTPPRLLGRMRLVCPWGGRRSEALAPDRRRRGIRHSDGRASSQSIPLAYTLRCASSSTAEQRTLNPQVSGSNPEGRTFCDLDPVWATGVLPKSEPPQARVAVIPPSTGMTAPVM